MFQGKKTMMHDNAYIMKMLKEKKRKRITALLELD